MCTSVPRPPLRPLAFSWSGYAYPRGLHSFPTRRSSDLRGAIRIRRLLRDHRITESIIVGDECLQRRRNLAGICADADVECRSRSEEHTSELQSQSNLVCRLLLEKKKLLRAARLRVL